MKEKHLYWVWLGLYILCAGCGMIPQRSLAGNIFLTVLSLVFFIPGILLVYKGITGNNPKILRNVRIISILSLVLTLSLILLNIILVFAGDTVGKLLNTLLVLFSAPMFCCYLRVISPFFWACLFVSSFPRMWKK